MGQLSHAGTPISGRRLAGSVLSRGKMVLVVIPALVICLLLVGKVLVSGGQETIRQATFHHLRSVADIQRQRIESTIAHEKRVLAAIQSRSALRRALQDVIDGRNVAANKAAIGRILGDAQRSDPSLLELSVVDPFGRIVASTTPDRAGDSVSDRAEFRTGLKDSQIGQFSLGPAHGLAVMVSGPLELDGRTIGVLTMVTDAAEFLDLSKDYSGLGETGEVVMARRNSDGDALYLTPLRFDPGAALRRTVPKSNTQIPINIALSGREGLFLSQPDYRGVPVLAVTQYLPEVDLGIVVKIDQAEAMAPAIGVEHRFWLVFSGAMVLMIGAVVWVVRANALAETRQRQLEENRRVQKHLATLAAIVESSDDAIISKGLDSIVTSWNPGAERLFGYGADEVIGQPMTMLFPPEREYEEKEIIARIAAGETVKHFEAQRRCKDGRLLDVSITISPIHDAAGQIIGASGVARDISERKREAEELDKYREHLEDLVAERTAQIREVNDRLHESEQFLTTITDNLPGMVGYWDKDLRCRFANVACCNHFRLTLRELQATSLPDLLGEEVYQRDCPMIEAVLAGIPQHFDRAIHRRSGRVGYNQCHFIPDIKDGVVVGFFVLVTDITALKRSEINQRAANQRLEEALQEAKVAIEAKSQFLANMSHEIRTPMNAVLGFIGLVLESELPDVTRRQLTTAHNAAKSLLLLLNDILDISKLQSGRIELENASFNLPRLLRSSLDMLRIKAREKKLDMQLLLPADMPQCYVGDAMRIRQIVTNLVGNAIKFTDAGEVVVSVAEGEESGTVQLSVRDTGIGMTPEQVDRIFTPFVQADSSTTRRFGGTGLGASICRQLAEIMGGRIWVESQIGAGSTFHVVLRLGAPVCDSGCQDEGFSGETAIRSRRRFRILLVDDIEENLELGEARLCGLGHSVTTARDGRQAVALADGSGFDLILMDVHMPEMSGLEATREIRRRHREGDYQVPIIALTASVMPSERQQCFEAGMNAFTGKPIDFTDLVRLMEGLVPPDRGEVVTEPGASTNPSEQALPVLAGIDVLDGMRRWNDFDRYKAALIRFAEGHAEVADGLRRSYEKGHWNAAYEQAHALKGVAANLAVADVARTAAALNEAFKRRQGDIDGLLDELASVWNVAATAIGNLSPPPGADGGTAFSEMPGAGIDLALLREVRAALDADDPGAVETLLVRLAAVMAPVELVPLRRLIGEFEFSEAKTLVDHWIALASPQAMPTA